MNKTNDKAVICNSKYSKIISESNFASKLITFGALVKMMNGFSENTFIKNTI